MAAHVDYGLPMQGLRFTIELASDFEPHISDVQEVLNGAASDIQHRLNEIFAERYGQRYKPYVEPHSTSYERPIVFSRDF